MGIRRRVVAWSGFGVLAALGAASATYFFRPKNDPLIIGEIPPSIELIPRSRFNVKPWVDLPWFGGRRLSIPTPPTKLRGFTDRSEISGLLTWSSPTVTHSKTVAGTTFIRSMQSYFGVACWTDEAGGTWQLKTMNEFRNTAGWLQDRAALPYVYGDRPRRFRVRWLEVHGVNPSKTVEESAVIELPPNHTPAPEAKTVEVAVGRWKVRLEARTPVSPGFAARYTASVVGAKRGEVFLLDVDEDKDSLSREGSFRLEVGRETVLTVRKSLRTWVLGLRRVVKDEGRLKVDRLSKGISGRSPSRYEVVDESGRPIAQCVQVDGRIFLWPNEPSKHAQIHLAGDRTPPGYNFGTPDIDMLNRPSSGMQMVPPVKVGTVLRCSVWRVTEQARGIWRL